MRIQHNIMAMSAYRNYNTNTSAVAKNLERLSSGYKINRAGDDAAGLAISEKMRAQITGLNAAQKNVKDGISLVKTAEGAMQEIQDMLNRMDYLATQSANGTYDNDVDRAALQKEVEQLKSEINRIADSANFNGIKLLDGSQDQGGRTQVIAGMSRILEGSTGKATGKGIDDVGTKTILDGAAATKDVKTEFKVDFNGMTAANGVAGNKPAEFTAADTLPNNVKGVTGTPANATDADVSVAVTIAGANAAASGAGDAAGALADLTISAGADNASKGNISVTFASGAADAAVYDADAGTLTITLANGGGTAGVYDKDALTAAIQALATVTSTGADTTSTIDLSKFTVTGTGTLDASAAIDAADGTVALTGGKATGDATVTLTGGVTGSTTVAAADWTGTDKAVTVGGLTVTFNADAITTDMAAAKIGTAKAAVNDAGDGTPKITVTLNGTDIATDVQLADGDDAKAIAAAVLAAITADGNNTALDIGADGTYTVTDNGDGSLKFVLNEDPTEDNIKGNFTWDVDVTDGSVTGAHTGGTQVTTAGSVASTATPANTVFEIKASDLTDGTEITLNGKTVTLKVGNSSTTGANLVTLTEDEAKDLDLALGKISKAFGDTTDFIVGVNNAGNDSTKGLTVHKKDGSTKTFDTMEKLAAEFSLKTKTAVDETKGLKLQIGDTSDSYNQLTVSIGDMHTTGAMNIDTLSVANQTDAAAAIQTIKDAINYVSGIRGDLGATQNRLEHTANNLSVMAENIQDAESTIRDTDIAEEMMAYTKNNILVQSAQAMLAQANQVPQGVLQLLG